MALRIGAEDKKKVYILSALGLVILFLLVRVLWQALGPSTPPAAPPASTAGPAVSRPEAGRPNVIEQPYAREAVKVASSSPLDPTLHPEVMEQAETLEYTGNGRNIFSQFSTPVEIPKAVAPIRPTAAAVTGPPPPPPIDLRYYGYASERAGRKQIFLLRGDDIFIAAPGDVVDHRYRVQSIGPASVQIEDIPYHDTQTLPLQQQ